MEEMLDVLLDTVTETRVKLISTDEARALVVLLGVLEEEASSGGVREAAGEMRLRLVSRLG